MVAAAFQTKARQPLRLLPQLPRQSQELTDKVENIERRLHELESALKFQCSVSKISREVQQLRQQIESPEIRSSGRYSELKSHLVGVAAAVSIGLALGNFSDKPLNGFVSVTANALMGQQNFTEPSAGSSRPAVHAPQIKNTDGSVKKSSTFTEQTKNVQRPVSTNSESVHGFDQKVDAVMRAIMGQESDGKFNLVNPHSGALGYFQLMPENVAPWSREALGYELTAEAFLQSPKLQLKVGKFKIAQYLESRKKGISEEQQVREVAAMWYSGQAKLWNNERPQYYNGHPYPSIAEYTRSVFGKYQDELARIVPAQAPSTSSTKPKTGNLISHFFGGNKKAQAAIAPQQQNLAQRIVSYMEGQGYEITRNPQEVNIIHLRNGNTARDRFEDKRLIIQFDTTGRPQIKGEWEETTKPGLHVVKNTPRRDGAIFIQEGQHKAWQVGTHVGANERYAHEALIQTGGAIQGKRDRDRDGFPDAPTSGYFGVNIHGPWSDGGAVEDRSAGCLVTRTIQAHREFMKLVKSDKRFLTDKSFVFSATVIDASKL